MRGLSGHAVAGRDRLERRFQVLRPANQRLGKVCPGGCHFVEQGERNEDRRFSHPELDPYPASLLKPGQESRITVGRKRSVEIFTQGWDQGFLRSVMGS